MCMEIVCGTFYLTIFIILAQGTINLIMFKKTFVHYSYTEYAHVLVTLHFRGKPILSLKKPKYH